MQVIDRIMNVEVDHKRRTPSIESDVSAQYQYQYLSLASLNSMHQRRFLDLSTDYGCIRASALYSILGPLARNSSASFRCACIETHAYGPKKGCKPLSFGRS